MVKMFDLRNALGISGETMRRWRRDGKLPPPDVEVSRYGVWWKVETLERAGIKLPAIQRQAEANRPMPASA